MAIRYYSPTGAAGTGDGTTWANRAALFSSGNWSSVLTGFNHSTDSQIAFVGPGTGSNSQAFTASLFTNAPSAQYPLLFAACDSSGNLVEPPDPAWCSPMPDWDDSACPIIQNSSGAIINCDHVSARMIRFEITGSNNASAFAGSGLAEWCVFLTNSSATNGTLTNPTRMANCVLLGGGSGGFNTLCGAQGLIVNSRFRQLAGTSGGNRRGIGTSSGFQAIGCTVVGFTGNGITFDGSGASAVSVIERCTIHGNGGAGIRMNATASQTQQCRIVNCYIANSGGWGIDNASSRTYLSGNRLRDNTSGNITGAGAYPTDFGNDVSAGTDADEIVSVAGLNYLLRTGGAAWGKGFGAGDQIPTGGSGGIIIG